MQSLSGYRHFPTNFPQLVLNLRYLEAQRAFVLEAGVPESRKTSQSQAS